MELKEDELIILTMLEKDETLMPQHNKEMPNKELRIKLKKILNYSPSWISNHIQKLIKNGYVIYRCSNSLVEYPAPNTYLHLRIKTLSITNKGRNALVSV